MTNPGSDEQQIRAIVETYARGCADAAPEVVGSVFADDAHMWGWLGDDYVTAPIGAFLDVVRDSAANPDRAAGYSFEILGVHVHGRQAQVTFSEANYLGMAFTNTFTLVRRDGAWRVVSKTFATLTS